MLHLGYTENEPHQVLFASKKMDGYLKVADRVAIDAET
jgi:hypothetical protein